MKGWQIALIIAASIIGAASGKAAIALLAQAL